MNRRGSRCRHRQHGNACGPGTCPETGAASRSECLDCLHAERPTLRPLLQQASRSVTAHAEISRTQTQSPRLMSLLLNRALPHRPCQSSNCCVELHMSRYRTTLTRVDYPKFFPFRSCCWKSVKRPSKSIRIPGRHAQASERHSRNPCGTTIGRRCDTPSLTGGGMAHSIAAAHDPHEPNGEAGLPCAAGGPDASNEHFAKFKKDVRHCIRCPWIGCNEKVA